MKKLLAIALLLLGTNASAAVVDAVEYTYAPWAHYFMAADPAEIAFLDSGTLGWVRTGQTFKVDSTAVSGHNSVCRFFSTIFNPKSSHFYTPFASECNSLKQGVGWQYEGIAFYVQVPTNAGTCPTGSNVYRLYNNGQGGAPNHRYTTSTTIRSQMIAQGWIPEGVGPNAVIFCTSVASSGGSVAYNQTANMVGGMWSMAYTFGIPYVDLFAFSGVSAGATATTPWFADGINKYGNYVGAGYYIPGAFMNLLSPLGNSFDYFVYTYTTSNFVSGCYYFLLNSTSVPGSCTPFAGPRSALAADKAMGVISETRYQGFADMLLKAQGPVGADVAPADAAEALRELMNAMHN